MTGSRKTLLALIFAFFTTLFLIEMGTADSSGKLSKIRFISHSPHSYGQITDYELILYDPESNTGILSPAAFLPLIQSPDQYLPPWLKYFNRFRTEGDLPHLSENSDWSHGGALHSRYMVKNDTIGHSENPSNPWYTPEGNAAAGKGNVFVSSSTSTSDESAIGFWIAGPFHAISMLDPELHTTGFGSYRESVGTWKMGATLDVLRGRGSLPAGTSYPLPFPRNGGQAWILTYRGNEWPDPLTSCPTYSAPTGPPIMLQLGSGNLTPNVTAHQLSTGGTILGSCRFDETNYTNPDGGAQSTGRSVLGARDAVVIMPRQPLVAGQIYHVSITANGSTTQWSFTAVSSPSSFRPAVAGEARIR